MSFRDELAFARLVLERDGEIIFDKLIDSAPVENEFFYTIYEGIFTEGNTIIVKGVKDVRYLPMRISIEK